MVHHPTPPVIDALPDDALLQLLVVYQARARALGEEIGELLLAIADEDDRPRRRLLLSRIGELLGESLGHATSLRGVEVELAVRGAVAPPPADPAGRLIDLPDLGLSA